MIYKVDASRNYKLRQRTIKNIIGSSSRIQGCASKRHKNSLNIHTNQKVKSAMSSMLVQCWSLFDWFNTGFFEPCDTVVPLLHVHSSCQTKGLSSVTNQFLSTKPRWSLKGGCLSTVGSHKRGTTVNSLVACDRLVVLKRVFFREKQPRVHCITNG